jgi:hypothetical protein
MPLHAPAFDICLPPSHTHEARRAPCAPLVPDACNCLVSLGGNDPSSSPDEQLHRAGFCLAFSGLPFRPFAATIAAVEADPAPPRTVLAGPGTTAKGRLEKMSVEFQYDVFLSHSAKDRAVVRPLAERLRQDGLHVWFDEWVLKPGDHLPAKIEEGLEHSRVLVLCMSAPAFGSDWARLESYTFRFRDPLNRQRRFIPLRLDDAPIKGSLAQFLYIDWRPPDRGPESH